MTRSKQRLDALIMSFSAWMADRRPKPLRPYTRYVYQRKVIRAIEIADQAGRSLLADDVKTIRFVLGSISPEPSTQAGYISALRAFFAFLVEHGLRKDNPAEDVRRPPLRRGTPRPLSLDDCCRYLDAARELGPRHYIIACLGLFQGFRREEIRTSRWADFFEANGRMWVDVVGKGGKRARLPVHRQTAGALRTLRDDHNEPEWLLPSPVAAKAGSPVSISYVQNKHEQILDEAGVRHATLHQLRHSFATYLRRAGADIGVVQKGLRHSDLTSTQIYMDVLDDEVAAAFDALTFTEDPPPVAAGGSVFVEAATTARQEALLAAAGKRLGWEATRGGWRAHGWLVSASGPPATRFVAVAGERRVAFARIEELVWWVGSSPAPS